MTVRNAILTWPSASTTCMRRSDTWARSWPLSQPPSGSHWAGTVPPATQTRPGTSLHTGLSACPGLNRTRLRSVVPLTKHLYTNGQPCRRSGRGPCAGFQLIDTCSDALFRTPIVRLSWTNNATKLTVTLPPKCVLQVHGLLRGYTEVCFGCLVNHRPSLTLLCVRHVFTSPRGYVQ